MYGSHCTAYIIQILTGTFALSYPVDESLVLDLVLILTPLLSPSSENGFVVVIWIGQQVPGEFISKVLEHPLMPLTRWEM